MPWRNWPQSLSAPPGSPKRRKELQRRTPLKVDREKRREFLDRAQRSAAQSQKRRSISPAAPAQRMAVLGRPCLVCGEDQVVHPAHVISRGMCGEGADDPRAVVPMCPIHHRLYDDGKLSILEYLEPRFRVELAFAVERFGLISTLERVTNEGWRPVNPPMEAA